MRTRVYLSGPITGIANFNRDAFFHEAARLEMAEGAFVFNPFSLPRAPIAVEALGETAVWQWYMRLCVAELTRCDSIRMLPHWQNSKGATWEHRIAEMLGMPISYCPVLSEENHGNGPITVL